MPKNNTDDYSYDYAILLGMFVDIVEERKDKNSFESWKYASEILSIKLFRHLVSLQSLMRISKVTHKGRSINFIDNSSAKVVVRAAFETYLVFFYIYGCSDDLGRFRHDIWHFAGLADRQKAHVTDKAYREQQRIEREIMDSLESKIKNSKFFEGYTPKQQMQLLKGNWRTDKDWSEIASDAGFHEKYFKMVYGYLCGYSHSSYISVLQIGQSRSIDDQSFLAKTVVNIALTIMAHYIFNFCNIFKINILEFFDEEGLGILQKWRVTAENMDSIYAE